MRCALRGKPDRRLRLPLLLVWLLASVDVGRREEILPSSITAWLSSTSIARRFGEGT